jgi:hypothetical protein
MTSKMVSEIPIEGQASLVCTYAQDESHTSHADYTKSMLAM